MSGSTYLKLSNYKTVWNDNFTSGANGHGSLPNPSVFPVSWGNADDFSTANQRLTLTSYAREGWGAVGFLQPDWSGGASQGYGLYSASFSLDANQGAGPCICLWPANNIWPGPEIDLAEDWSDPTRQTGYATLHWAQWVNGQVTNQYQVWQYHADMTRKTSVAMDWEKGSLTLYVNNKEVFHYTGPHVPLDAAHGGVNEAFGGEVSGAGGGGSSVALHLYNMSYGRYAGAALATGAASPAISPATTGGSDVAPVLVGANTGAPPDLPGIAPDQGGVTYSFATVSGQDVLNNFLPSDALALSPALRAAMTESAQNGGTLLSFGANSSIFLPGIAHLGAGQIHEL